MFDSEQALPINDMATEGYFGRKNREVKVELLEDDTSVSLLIGVDAPGSLLLDMICEGMEVKDRDYFGLLHELPDDPRAWVDLNKRLSKTFKNRPWEVKLVVKFYPPEPSEMKNATSRAQLMLGIKKELEEGRLKCSPITQALLTSYLLQSMMQDYDAETMATLDLAEFLTGPLSALNPELEAQIVELYKKHAGQTMLEADENFLEVAKRLPLYGAELHAAQNSDDAPIFVGVCGTGVFVYRDGLIMNRFPWAKINRICYNKRMFTLKLRAGEFDEFETHLSFKLPSNDASKKLWRNAVEHHMFFSMASETLENCCSKRETPVKVDRTVGFLRLGSRRMSCRRTLRQIRSETAIEAA